jgi:Holliday junction resolvase
MVDARAKGARGEYLVRDMLRTHTGLQFERIPSSGALAYLKGDLFVPHANNRFCIEVKNYAESPFNDKIFTAQKTNNLIKWWLKLKSQAKLMEQEPLLFFKYNRSKVFVGTELKPKNTIDYVNIAWLNCNLLLAEEWLTKESVEFMSPIKQTGT